MEKHSVKIFASANYHDVEKSVNTWLHSNPAKVILSIEHAGTNNSFSALIHYKDN